MSVPLDERYSLAADLQEVRQAMTWYYEKEQRHGELSVDESRGLVLLEAEELLLAAHDEVIKWEEEHPKFVAAVHEWVEYGYNQTQGEGKPCSRLEVLHDIIIELHRDEEASELLESALRIEREYRAEAELERVLRPESNIQRSLGAQALEVV